MENKKKRIELVGTYRPNWDEQRWIGDGGFWVYEIWRKLTLCDELLFRRNQ